METVDCEYYQLAIGCTVLPKKKKNGGGGGGARIIDTFQE